VYKIIFAAYSFAALHTHGTSNDWWEANTVKDYIEQRVLMTAEYIVDKNATVREAAKQFKVSKSTVHKDMVERLPRINKELSRDVRKVLAFNKAERHLRGGKATYIKYKNGFRKVKKVHC
jgi:putative DeoR family transcriptional regulator (stage III sporulation protein D)